LPEQSYFSKFVILWKGAAKFVGPRSGSIKLVIQRSLISQSLLSYGGVQESLQAITFCTIKPVSKSSFVFESFLISMEGVEQSLLAIAVCAIKLVTREPVQFVY
jgi:hypothetical protein